MGPERTFFNTVPSLVGSARIPNGSLVHQEPSSKKGESSPIDMFASYLRMSSCWKSTKMQFLLLDTARKRYYREAVQKPDDTQNSEDEIINTVISEAVVKIFLKKDEFELELAGAKLVLSVLRSPSLWDATPFLVANKKVVVLAATASRANTYGRMLYKRFATTLSNRTDWVFETLRSIVPLLSALHEENVYHRDIKPQNIFVDPETEMVALGDYGLVSEVTKLCGSPFYLPPELLIFMYPSMFYKDIFWTYLKEKLDFISECETLFGFDHGVIFATKVIKKHFFIGDDIEQYTTYKPRKLPWFLDCYALGITVLQCCPDLKSRLDRADRYDRPELKKKLKRLLVITGVLMTSAPDRKVGLSHLRMVDHLSREDDMSCMVPQFEIKPWSTAQPSSTMRQDLSDVQLRKIGKGNYGSVFKILDRVGIAMLLCQGEDVKLHCFEKGVSTIRSQKKLTSLPTEGMLCAYQEDRAKAGKMMQASRRLCQTELRKIFPVASFDKQGVHLLGMDVDRVRFPGQPTMLLYRAHKCSVETTDLPRLCLFLLRAHRAGVIHGDIRRDVLVTISNDDPGIVAFSQPIPLAHTHKFDTKAFEDLSKLCDLFGREPKVTRETYANEVRSNEASSATVATKILGMTIVGRTPVTIGRPPVTIGRPPVTIVGRTPVTIGRPPVTIGRTPVTQLWMDESDDDGVLLEDFLTASSPSRYSPSTVSSSSTTTYGVLPVSNLTTGHRTRSSQPR
jgi:hypothetical protein